MLTLDKISSIITNTLNKMKTPADILPTVLLNCVAMRRPGLSAAKIAAQIISNNNAIGIPTGLNPDGTPNMINEYTYNIVKCVIDAIQQDGVVQVAIPAGTIMVQTEGANAGGPLVGVGTNVINSVAKGLIR